MKTLTRTALCAGLSLCAASAFAQPYHGDSEAAASGSVMNKDWTIEQCKDYMANPNRGAPSNDDATVNNEARCAEMMKNDPSRHTEDSSRQQDNGSASPDTSSTGSTTDSTKK